MSFSGILLLGLGFIAGVTVWAILSVVRCARCDERPACRCGREVEP